MLKKSFFAAIFACLFCVQMAVSQSLISGTVVDAVDGRTLVIETASQKRVNVRLRYLETPEPEQPLAEIVKQHLKELSLGKKISVTSVRITENSVTGIVTIQEKSRKFDLIGQMLRDGAGWLDVREADSGVENVADSYKELELAAKVEKRGVWGVPDMKTPSEFRREKQAALAKLNKPVKSFEEPKTVETSLVSSIKNSGNSRVDNRRLPIYDFDFGDKDKTNPKDIGASQQKSGGQTPAGLSSNLSQVYFAQFNKGTISTKPYEFDVRNGTQGQKVTAMFLYGYSMEGSSKNVGKIGLMIMTDFKTKPLLQGKNVSLIMDGGKKVNLGVPKYLKSKYGEGIVFEDIAAEEISAIPSSNSLTLTIGKSKTVLDDTFKPTIDEFINTLK